MRAILLCLLLSGCTLFQPRNTVALTTADLELIASEASAYVQHRFPAASTKLALSQPREGNHAGAELAAELDRQLRSLGFGVAAGEQPGMAAVSIALDAGDAGVLVSLRIDADVATRFYQVNATGSLSGSGGLTVRRSP